jgi:hypothetical protein
MDSLPPRETSLEIGTIYRYPKPMSLSPEINEKRNFFAVTEMANSPSAMLEKGISPIAFVGSGRNRRRPAILLRSSPAKAGSTTTPWHDVFDLEKGRVRYFGDHKVSTPGPVGGTAGNSALLEASTHHAGQDRHVASPLLLFRTITVGSAVKGYVEFVGLAVIERLERIDQFDDESQRSFPNFVYDLVVLRLTNEAGRLDWRWINARRDGRIPLDETTAFGPLAWRRWVMHGG